MAPEGRQLEKSLRPDGFAPFLIRLLGMAQGYGSNPSGPPSLGDTGAPCTRPRLVASGLIPPSWHRESSQRFQSAGLPEQRDRSYAFPSSLMP